MAGVIETGPVVYGYCACCDRPAVVVLLRIAGWNHAPTVCGRCLREISTLTDTAPQGVKP